MIRLVRHWACSMFIHWLQRRKIKPLICWWEITTTSLCKSHCLYSQPVYVAGNIVASLLQHVIVITEAVIFTVWPCSCAHSWILCSRKLFCRWNYLNILTMCSRKLFLMNFCVHQKLKKSDDRSFWQAKINTYTVFR